jgi:hypothetical protein
MDSKLAGQKISFHREEKCWKPVLKRSTRASRSTSTGSGSWWFDLGVEAGHLPREGEIAPHGLPDPLAVEGPGQVIDDVVGDGRVIFVAKIDGGHEVEALRSAAGQTEAGLERRIFL